MSKSKGVTRLNLAIERPNRIREFTQRTGASRWSDDSSRVMMRNMRSMADDVEDLPNVYENLYSDIHAGRGGGLNQGKALDQEFERTYPKKYERRNRERAAVSAPPAQWTGQRIDSQTGRTLGDKAAEADYAYLKKSARSSMDLAVTMPGKGMSREGLAWRHAGPNSISEWRGYQQGFRDRPGFNLYNLKIDLPGHRTGSTVSEKTLLKHGYAVPQRPRAHVDSNTVPGMGEGGWAAKLRRLIGFGSPWRGIFSMSKYVTKLHEKTFINSLGRTIFGSPENKASTSALKMMKWLAPDKSLAKGTGRRAMVARGRRGQAAKYIRDLRTSERAGFHQPIVIPHNFRSRVSSIFNKARGESNLPTGEVHRNWTGKELRGTIAHERVHQIRLKTNKFKYGVPGENSPVSPTIAGFMSRVSYGESEMFEEALAFGNAYEYMTRPVGEIGQLLYREGYARKANILMMDLAKQSEVSHNIGPFLQKRVTPSQIRAEAKKTAEYERMFGKKIYDTPIETPVNDIAVDWNKVETIPLDRRDPVKWGGRREEGRVARGGRRSTDIEDLGNKRKSDLKGGAVWGRDENYDPRSIEEIMAAKRREQYNATQREMVKATELVNNAQTRNNVGGLGSSLGMSRGSRRGPSGGNG